MNVKPIGSNQTLLTTNHGDEVLFSYETAVAGNSHKIVWFRNNHTYSNTTSKHVNKYLNERAGDNKVTLLTPIEIELMFLND